MAGASAAASSAGASSSASMVGAATGFSSSVRPHPARARLDRAATAAARAMVFFMTVSYFFRSIRWSRTRFVGGGGVEPPLRPSTLPAQTGELRDDLPRTVLEVGVHDRL